MAGSQTNQTQVPVRLDMYTSDGHHWMFNMFNFDAKAAETTAFDIKPCFKWDEQRYVQFNLKGQRNSNNCLFLVDIPLILNTVFTPVNSLASPISIIIGIIIIISIIIITEYNGSVFIINY